MCLIGFFRIELNAVSFNTSTNDNLPQLHECSQEKKRKSCVEIFDRLSDVATKTKKASFSSSNSISVSIVRTLYIYVCRIHKSYIHMYIGSSNFGKFACRINLHGMSVSYIHLNTILCDILKTLTSRVLLKPIVGFA
jgi:hypothetical protein